MTNSMKTNDGQRESGKETEKIQILNLVGTEWKWENLHKLTIKKKGGGGEGREGKGSTQFITTQTTPQGSLKENPTLQFLLTLNLWECLTSQYYSWIKILGHENKGNDHQRKKLLIVKQILLSAP